MREGIKSMLAIFLLITILGGCDATKRLFGMDGFSHSSKDLYAAGIRFEGKGKTEDAYIIYEALVKHDESSDFSIKAGERMATIAAEMSKKFGVDMNSEDLGSKRCENFINGHPALIRAIVWDDTRLLKKDDRLLIDCLDIIWAFVIRRYGKISTVEIPSGEFMMGSPAEEEGRNDFEPLPHSVTISKPFLMASKEVTQLQWCAVMRENPSSINGHGLPVERISWFDSIRFCNELSELNELQPAYTISDEDVTWDQRANGYRLPTEAEWEYACRSGARAATYNGDLTIIGIRNSPECDEIAWYGGNSGIRDENGVDCSGWKEKQYSSDLCGPHAVGLKKPNAWGLYDMVGNVWEWCWDWYSIDLPEISKQDPTGPSSGSERVVRSSPWLINASNCRCALRLGGPPKEIDDHASPVTGVRPVRSLQR